MTGLMRKYDVLPERQAPLGVRRTAQGAHRPQAGGIIKKKRKVSLPLFSKMLRLDYTQPVGLGRPAILQAPLPGPEGKSSYTSFSL